GRIEERPRSPDRRGDAAAEARQYGFGAAAGGDGHLFVGLFRLNLCHRGTETQRRRDCSAAFLSVSAVPLSYRLCVCGGSVANSLACLSHPSNLISLARRRSRDFAGALTDCAMGCRESSRIFTSRIASSG